MKPQQLLLQVDGTPGIFQGQAGVSAIIRGPRGHVYAWRCDRVAAATCNEAEYHAIILGLKFVVERYPHAHIRCLSDSQIAVEQLCGRSAVRALALQLLHQHAQTLAEQVAHVEFIYIPRNLNRLADALAWEALGGQWSVIRYLKKQGA